MVQFYDLPFDIQAGDSLTMSGGGFTRNYTIPDLAVTILIFQPKHFQAQLLRVKSKLKQQTELIGRISLYSLTNPVFGHTYSQPLTSIQARTVGWNNTMIPTIPL